MAAIAQKVLGNILGKYIDGLDRNNINVGIWSGNFQIENVALKKEISDMFSLPFNLKFNHIGKISAKIPWKSLSYSPVEIELEDLLLIATPKSQADLMLIAVNIFNDRQKFLEEFAAGLDERLKKGGKEEAPGYFAGLITKIVDNVQVSIKNIHIRFECELDQKCSFNFGITMDSLTVFTTDERGNKTFIDRSKAENIRLPVNKKLILDDFSFYWNDKGMQPMANIQFKRDPKGILIEVPLPADQKAKIISKLRTTIISGMGAKKDKVNDFQYLINLSIDAKMIQYKKTQDLIDHGIPEIELNFNLDRLSSVLSKSQFGQIMALMNYFSDYMAMAKKEQEKLRFKYLRPLKSIARGRTDSKANRSTNIRAWWRFAYLAIKKTKQERNGFFTVLRMDKKQRDNYAERFKMLFSKIDFTTGKAYSTFMTPDELDIYQVIIMSLDESVLKKSIEDLLREKQKIAKKESKKGWFGWGNNKEIKLTDDEEKEINDLINEVVKQEEDKFVTPDSFKWLKVKFFQKECNLSLQKTNASGQVESVDALFSNFEVNLMLRKKGMDVDLGLQNLEITSCTHVSKINVITDQIFRPLIETNPENKLVDLKFASDPVGYSKTTGGKDSQLDMLVSLKVKSSEIYYNQKMIETLIDVFDNKEQLEALKRAANEQAEIVAQQSQQKLNDILKTQKTIIVDINVAAPLIILPFNQSEIVMSECWVMSPGVLKVIGDNFNIEDRADREGLDHYDNYMIGLENIKIEYMPSILDYMQTYTPSLLKATKNRMLINMAQNKEMLKADGKIANYPQFDLLKNFNITLDMNILKPAYIQLNFKEPRFKLSAFISKLQVDLNQKIYSDTLRFGDIFQSTSGGAPQLQMDKKGLLSASTKFDSLIRGNSITGFSKVKEFAILSQGRLYYFKDRKEQAAYDYFSLKDAKVKLLTAEESGHPFALKVVNGNGSHQLLAFEQEKSRTEWALAIENECRKLRAQAAQSAAASMGAVEAATPHEGDKTAEGELGKVAGATKKTVEETKSEHLAFVQIKMEEMNMRVFNIETQMFDFAITNLGVAVDVKETETKVKVTLEKVNISDTKEQDPNLKMLISSEINSSIATKVKGLGVSSENTSKTLVSIDVAIIDPKSAKYSQVDTDVNIAFGSLFVNLRPSQINKLMVFFIPVSDPKEAESEKAKAIEALTASKTTSNVAVVSRTKQLIKRENDKVIQLKVRFSLEKISLIMVNEVKNIYQAHASISAIKIEFISKLTGMKLDGTLSNLQLHDLTNYPDTLTQSDFNSIVPNELFGISSKEDSNSLITLGFEKINSDIAELEETNVNGYLNVSVDQIKVNFYMQVVMRILDYLTGQLLAALSIDDLSSQAQKKSDPLQETPSAAPTSKTEVTEGMAINNLSNPFWMKMNVNVTQPIVILKCAASFTEYLQVELGDIKIFNRRIQEPSRIISNRADPKHETLGLGEKLLGIWMESFFISMTDLSIKKIVENDSRKHYQYFMHPFNFNLCIEMVQYIEDYKILFRALADPVEVYTEYSLTKKVLSYTDERSPNLLTFDGSMTVRARISPMVMVFGNAEFNFLMKLLFHNITYNDFRDGSYSKAAEEKERQLKQKKATLEDVKDPKNPISPVQVEQQKGSTMNVCIDIDYIALVAMDTVERDSPGFDGDRIIETRKAYAKLFIKELRVEVLMRSDADMYVGLYIRRLIASYLEDKNKSSSDLDLLEKGFIGKMSVYQEFFAKSCDELRNKLIDELKESISEKGEEGSYGLSKYSTENLMLNVEIFMSHEGEKNIRIALSQMRILAQTNVLLKLSGLAQMSSDCTPPEAAVDPVEKKRILNEQAFEKQKRLIEIRDYFNKKLLRTGDGSRSMSAVSDNKLKQTTVMTVVVDIKKVMFVIPTQEHKETLVTSGDLSIRLEMNQAIDMNELWEIQEGLRKNKKQTDIVESINLGMKVNISLFNFQIFYCDFVQLLQNTWKKVPKRHIMMPIKLAINFFDFNPVGMRNNELEYYSYKKIGGSGESIIFKLTLSDVDVLSRISAYQMTLLGGGAEKPAEEPKTITSEESPADDLIEKAIKNVDEAQKLTEPLLKENVLEKKLDEPPLQGKLKITDFKISGLQIFLINDDQKIFVPVLDFVITNILVSMYQGSDMSVQLSLGMGIDYYNPSVSKWEPFIEKTNLMTSVRINDKNNLQTTHVMLKLDEIEKDQEEVLNINLSVKALAVVMRSLDTFSNWNQSRAEAEKKIKGASTSDYLSHLVNIEDKQELEQNNLTGPGNLSTEEKVEAIFDEEEEKVDYVSPYLIKNLTGYPISAEEYVNKTYFQDESIQEKDIKEAAQKKSNSKKSRYTKEKLGTVYQLANEDKLNLKLETASKFKKNKGEQKFTLEEQMTDAQIMVTIKHDQFKIKPLFDLPLDQQYSKRKRLEGDHRILSEFSVICDNFFDDQKKTLTVSSPVLLENLANVGVVFRVLKKRKEYVDIQLNPGDLKPVPFDLVANNYQILFNGTSTDVKELQKFTNKEDGYSQKISLAKDLHIIAKVKRDPDIFQRIIIVLLPVIKIKNCLPFPLDFSMQQVDLPDKEHTLLPQEETQVYCFDPDLPIKLKTKTQGLNYSELYTLVDKQTDCDVDEINMRDNDGNKATLKIARISNEQNMFSYYFYADAILVNETEIEFEPIYVNSKGVEQSKVAGSHKLAEDQKFNQSVMILNSIDSNIKLNVSQSYLDVHYPNFKNAKQPDTLPLKALDALAYNCLVENKAMQADKRLFELGVYMSPLFVDKQENIYTKIIQVSPRNIFYNCTQHILQIRQADTDQVQEIGPNQRQPYWWASAGRDKKLQVRIVDSDSEWSSKFDAKILGAMPMAVKQKDGTAKSYYYEVKIDAAIEFTYFKEISESEPFFSFKNESAKFQAEVFQKNHEEQFKQVMGHDQEESFSWIAPDANKTAVIKLSAEGFQDLSKEIDISKINTNERIKLVSKDKATIRFVNIGVVLRKTTKYVKIRDVLDIHGEEKAEQHIDQQVATKQLIFDLLIQGIGLSLVSPYKDGRIEPLYIFLGGIETLCSINDHHTLLHFKLKYINIDNNSTPMSPFPVIFTPSFKEKANKEDFYLITFKMDKRNESKPEIQLYDELVFDIQPITIGIDDIALGIILDVVSTVQKTVAAKPNVRYQHKYFHISNNEEQPELTIDTVDKYEEPRLEWQIKEPTVSQTWIYAKEFKISVLDLTLSYKTRAQQAKNELLGFGIIFKTLGVALANIDEANIKIRGVKFEHVFETQDSLTNKLMQHYKDNGIKQGLKIIGSIDILGNPVNLFTKIGTGVVDFFEKPIEGFAKGPLDAAKGIGQGTVSLVKNTTKGVLNSASKATGAVSSAFSALSMVKFNLL